MSRVVSIRLSNTLHAELCRHAKSRNIRPSEAARDLLRRSLEQIDANESGYAEGKLAGYRETMKQLNGVEP